MSFPNKMHIRWAFLFFYGISISRRVQSKTPQRFMGLHKFREYCVCSSAHAHRS